MPPLILTLHEALLLRLALSSLSQLSETPFKQEREDLDQFTQTLSLVVPSRPSPTPYLDHLLESAQEERWVAVIYRSEKGVSQQTLLPARVRTEAGFWYCEAYSYERKAMRVYRIDRFLEVRAAQPPPQAECPSSIISNGHPSLPEVRIHLTARGGLGCEVPHDTSPPAPGVQMHEV